MDFDVRESQLFAPSWTPDGSQIIFFTDYEHGFAINTLSLDGKKHEQILAVPEVHINPDSGLTAWSPDGSQLAFVSSKDHIYILDLPTASYMQLPVEAYEDFGPRLSWQP